MTFSPLLLPSPAQPDNQYGEHRHAKDDIADCLLTFAVAVLFLNLLKVFYVALKRLPDHIRVCLTKHLLQAVSFFKIVGFDGIPAVAADIIGSVWLARSGKLHHAKNQQEVPGHNRKFASS